MASPLGRGYFFKKLFSKEKLNRFLGTASSFGKGLFPKPLEKNLIGFWVRLLPSGRAFSQNHSKNT